tara:strand:- start:13382 stop:14614 length:1233 start_codon:yes stop_codon:yes gene_type:complete
MILKSRIKQGRLVLKFKDGSIERYGSEGPEVTWVLQSPATMKRIFRNWELRFGEAYIDGEWEVEGGSLLDLMSLLRRNFTLPNLPWVARLSALALYVQQGRNSIGLSRSNVARHYDLDTHLFQLFLDKEMNYSCGYFETPDTSLEAAQRAKCELIAKKLALLSGQRVLDIGCGWGSLAMYLAERYRVHVTGLTLSEEQHSVAVAEVKSRGLDKLVDIRIEDYRKHQGSYDRVVSVGMFEHVGRKSFYDYFKAVDDFLNDDGVALIHSIGRTGFPRRANSWMRTYIFPGGYLPALSEITRAVEKTNLNTADIEVLRRHYELTLAAWRSKFMAARDEFVKCKGERFTRIWEFYLTIAEVAFRCTDICVFQMQFLKQDDTLPITRNYMYGRAVDDTTSERERDANLSLHRPAN